MRISSRFMLPLMASALLLAFSFMSCGSASAEMTREKALKVIRTLAPDATILGFHPAPIGLYEVDIKSNGQTGILYIDREGKYIIMGSLLDVATKKNITKERFEEITKVNTSEIPLADAVVVGDPKARYKVIVFSDPDCPYCVRLQAELDKVVKERKDIAFFIKLFPLKSIHPDSYRKSKAIACERDKAKALRMLEDAFAKKSIPQPSCDTKVIDDNLALGEKLGVQGTPTLIFPNGKRGSGMTAQDIISQATAAK